MKDDETADITWRATMVEGGHGIPGVRESNKAARVVASVQGLGARAHTASAASTPPDSKVGMVGSQQVWANHRSVLEEQANNNNFFQKERRARDCASHPGPGNTHLGPGVGAQEGLAPMEARREQT